MKRIIYRTIIIFIMVSAMYITKTYATGSFSISASKSSINKGETVTVSIKANNAYGEVAVTAKNGTVTPSTVFLRTGSDTETVKVTSTSDEDIEITAAPGKNGLGDIDENPITRPQNLTIKVNKTNTSTDNNQGNQNTDTGNNTTASKSKEARLKTFGITPNDFTGFKRDKTDYSTEVPNNISEVTVYATAVDSKAKVTGTGKISLKEGNNTVKVTVTAEAGNTKTYNLTIKRKTATEDASSTTTTTTTTTEPGTSNTTNTSNAFGLDSLDIDDITLSPKFDTEVYEYTAELNKDLSSLEISTIPTDDDTTVEIAGNKDLKDGENIITIIVQSKKTKKTVTYQITVNKNVLATENNNEEAKEANWMNPSTWGKEEIIKMIIIAVLLILIIVAIILKVKISKEKKEDEIDLPGADELDRAIAEHQELSELEENENNTWNWDDDFQEDFNEAPKKKGKGKHF